MRLNDSRGKREKGERDSEFVRSRLTILWSISRHSSTGYTLEPRESSRIKVKRTEWTHGENTGVDIELAVYLPSRMEYCGETFQTECRSLSLSLSFSHTHTHTHTYFLPTRIVQHHPTVDIYDITFASYVRVLSEKGVSNFDGIFAKEVTPSFFPPVRIFN